MAYLLLLIPLPLPLTCLPALIGTIYPQEFNLIDERELAPLKELIDRMVR
jgi:hypothetical protein